MRIAAQVLDSYLDFCYICRTVAYIYISISFIVNYKLK